ncbi:MAG: glycosyltransferase [candidate division Zixibacteria bacterium]|nr:glycosyltransferase [candidate division Zixibacteria bacterium]
MKPAGLKVLVLADSVAFHTERFAAELRRQGCHVLVASLERGVMHHFHIRKRGAVKCLHYMLAIPQVRVLIRRFQPDIINPHFASGYGALATLARGSGGVPIVLNLWGSDILIVPHKSFLHRWKTRRALKTADFVIGDSNYLLEAAAKLSTLAKQRMIPWGIERANLALHKDNYQFRHPLRIIIPRMHAPVYNNLFIVRALRPMVRDGDVFLTFPGFGSCTDEFKREAGNLLGNGIELYERMERPDFLRLMAGFDIYLSAARSDSSPVSLIEAMALGLVPVAADIPGIREWLTPDNGYTYREDDENNLRTVISNLHKRSDVCDQMRRSNLDTVRRKAVFENNVAEQIEIMQTLVNRK